MGNGTLGGVLSSLLRSSSSATSSGEGSELLLLLLLLEEEDRPDLTCVREDLPTEREETVCAENGSLIIASDTIRFSSLMLLDDDPRPEAERL